jgi:hypothetical protein
MPEGTSYPELIGLQGRVTVDAEQSKTCLLLFMLVVMQHREIQIVE